MRKVILQNSVNPPGADHKVNESATANCANEERDKAYKLILGYPALFLHFGCTNGRTRSNDVPRRSHFTAHSSSCERASAPQHPIQRRSHMRLLLCASCGSQRQRSLSRLLQLAS